MKRTKKWTVRNERPEELFENPELYYTDEEVEKYARSGGMRRAQQSIAYRILELLDLEKGKKILDLGCGVGYTMGIYLSEGYDVVGLDIMPNMLKKAKDRGFKVVEGDMRKIDELFKKEEFDAVVSASSLQWLKKKEDLTKVARGINYVLKNNGKLVIQFYPKSEEEMMQTAKIFRKEGFKGNVVIDNPDIPRKRTIYLVFEKISQT